MKELRAIIYLSAIVLFPACWEPPYRYDVRGNGQGGVDIQHVPKDPATAPSAVAQPAPPPAPTSEASDQVEQLKAQVKALSDENQKLKQKMSATAPSNNPGKE